MENLMKKVGCHPPHWKTKYDVPIYSNASQMKTFSKQPTTFTVESFGQPCKLIDRLQYSFKEYKIDGYVIIVKANIFID